MDEENPIKEAILLKLLVAVEESSGASFDVQVYLRGVARANRQPIRKPQAPHRATVFQWPFSMCQYLPKSILMTYSSSSRIKSSCSSFISVILSNSDYFLIRVTMSATIVVMDAF